jgi:hypothetical protein
MDKTTDTERNGRRSFPTAKPKVMKMAVFWVVAPCSLVEVVASIIRAMMEAARTSETLVTFHQTTRRYNLEDSHLHSRLRENLKFYKNIDFPNRLLGRQLLHLH